MNQLMNMNLDTMRAELNYRHDQLVGVSHRGQRSVRRWWQRVALVPRERG